MGSTDGITEFYSVDVFLASGHIVVGGKTESTDILGVAIGYSKPIVALHIPVTTVF